MNRWIGPALVALGAALWGIEIAWRVPLGMTFRADVLVLHEHVLMAIIFLPHLVGRRAELRKATKASWAYLVFSGVAGSAVGAVLLTAAFTRKDANLAVISVILNLQPIVSTGGAFALFKERLAPAFWGWAILAIAGGVFLSIDVGSVTLHGAFTPGTFLALQCVLFWGLATVAGRGAMRVLPMSVAAAVRVMVGLVTMFAICAVRGELGADDLWPAEAHAHAAMTGMRLILLATVSGALPLAVYFQGLKTTPASTAGYCEMMQTISAAAIAWISFASPLTLPQIAAALVLVFSVAMVQTVQARVRDSAASGRPA